MGHHFVKISWIDPLICAEKITQNYDDNWSFLYSGLNSAVKNSRSYLAIFPQEQLICHDFLVAESLLKSSDKKWFGYFSYEVGKQFEKLPKTEESFINLPKIWLINFAVIVEFQHDKQLVKIFYQKKKQLEHLIEILSKTDPQKQKSEIKISQLHSNFSDSSYLDSIKEIKAKIADGDIYQTNLTRKFFGNFAEEINEISAFDLFKNLTQISPANYSAFLKLDKNYVISSSPELFLQVKKNKIISRPIKGTTPRDPDPKQDRKNKLHLKNSAKELAENLMIVDLVRNDLSRVCKAGSVVVKKPFHVTSYQNIHHMSSEVHGQIDDNYCAVDVLKNSFPAGSMTGAPKIKAMEIAALAERFDRGIYSGTIGMFAKNEINSSVVIRTLLTSSNKFEFQVGGGITFDSVEYSELEETFNKARGISQLLQVKLK